MRLAHHTLRPWLESAVALAIAWLLSRPLGLTPPGLDLLLVPVVLAAARFGYVVGAGAGAAAGLLSLVSAGQAPGAFLAAFADRSHLGLAFAFFALGALVGLVGDMPWNRARRLGEELAQARENFSQLQERYGVLLAAKEAIDRRIVGQVATVASLYEAARELETLVPAEIPPAILRLLARFLEVEAAAVYLREGPALVLASARGEIARPEALAPDSPLARAAARRQALSFEAGEEAGALLAAPIHAADGASRGLIAIERIPFRQLTPATMQMLELFADWAGRALANSEAYARAQELQRDHPVTGLRRTAYVLERLTTEWASARRYKLPLSVILVRQAALETASDEAWAEEAAALAAVLKGRVRNIDVVGHHRTRDTFLMLLPVTPLEGARILAGRLAEAAPGTRVAVGGNEEGIPDAETLLQALQAEVFPEDVRHAS